MNNQTCHLPQVEPSRGRVVRTPESDHGVAGSNLVGRPDTGSYTVPSPVPALEILFEVNLNFQVRLT